MKRIYFALALSFILLSCNSQYERKYSDGSEFDTIYVETDSTDIGFQKFDRWRIKTYSFSGYFGMIDSQAHSLDSVDMYIPDVEDLYWRNRLDICETDTCTSIYSFLALRCPPTRNLLDWVQHEIFGDSVKYNCNSVKKIVDLCMDQQIDIDCQHDETLHAPNCQNGLMIVDIWKVKNYYTFLRAEWFDQQSCGDNTRNSYHTLDSDTGKELALNDFIQDKDTLKLKDLIFKHVCFEDGCRFSYRYEQPETKNELLSSMDGCALLPMGFLVYYFPYVLGCGADGHAYAVIPYDELEKEGINLKVIIN